MAEPRCWLFHCARSNEMTPIVSMGLWGLADCLTRRGFPTQVLHTRIEEARYPGEFDLGRYIGPETLLAGFSAHWFPQLPEALDLAREIKRRWPHVYVVMGGYSASYFSEVLMTDSPWIDGIVRGDGEVPLMQLAEQLSRPEPERDLAAVPNLVWRDQQKVRCNPQTYVSTAEDLSEIDYANFSAYLHNYAFALESGLFHGWTSLVMDFAPTNMAFRKTFYLLTGKGCPVNCLMCGGGRDAQAAINLRHKLLFLPDGQVLETIRKAMAHGYENFYICFDPIPNRPRYFSYLRAIREAGFELDISFGFWGLPTPEAVRELKATARQLLVEISPDSASEAVRRQNRGFDYSNAQLSETLDLLYREQVYTHVYYGYFLPHDTEETVLATRAAMWELNARYPHYIEAAYIKISTDPASPLYRAPARHDTDLTVSSLQEHLAAVRQESQTNVMVHRIRSISPERQAALEKLLIYDSRIKRMFKYLVKLLVRAFPSVPDFLAYLDAFYTSGGLMEGEQAQDLMRSPLDVLTKLAAFTRAYLASRPDVQAILQDIVDFAAAQAALVTAPDQAPGQGSPASGSGPALSRIPTLSGAAVVAQLGYNIPRAVEHLVGAKAFPSLEPELTSLLFMRRGEEMGVWQMNETLTQITEACRANEGRTVAEIAADIATQYAEEAEQQQYIAADLQRTMADLFAAGVLCDRLPLSRTLHTD